MIWIPRTHEIKKEEAKYTELRGPGREATKRQHKSKIQTPWRKMDASSCKFGEPGKSLTAAPKMAQGRENERKMQGLFRRDSVHLVL